MNTDHVTSPGSENDASVDESSGLLSTRTEEQILDQIVALSESGQPLHQGLRRIIPLLPSRREAAIVRRICRRLESGAPLDVALGNGVRDVGVIAAVRIGLESGRLGPVLEQYLLATRNSRRVWRTFWSMLLYPIGVTIASLLLFLLIGSFVTPTIKSVFEDFGLALPGITLMVLALIDARWLGVSVIIGVTLTVVTMIVGHRRLPGRRVRERIANAIPVVGRARCDAATAEVCGLMAVFLEADLALNRALGMAGRVARTALLEDSLTQVADRMRAGASAADAVDRIAGLPASLVPLLRLTGARELQIEGFRTASDLHMALSEARVRQVATILQPLAIMVIGLSAGLMVIAIFAPMLRLLNVLT